MGSDSGSPSRLPGFMERRRLPGAAWQWAIGAGLLHGLLAWLISEFVGRARSGAVGSQALFQGEWTGIIFSSLVVGALVGGLARLVEQQLRDDAVIRERLFDIVDALPQPAAVRDLHSRYVLWNQAAERFYGVPAHQVLGRLPGDLFPEAMADRIVKMDRLVMQGTEPVEGRVRIPPIYGRPRRLVDLRVAPVRTLDHSLRLRGVVSISTDITGIQRATDLAREADIHLRLALESTGMCTWVWYVSSDRVHYADNFAIALRYHGNDFRRQFVFRDRLHPEDRDRAINAVQHCVATREPYDESFRIRCFDEQYRSFRGRGQVLTDLWGEPVFAGVLMPLSGPGPRAASVQG